MCQWPTPLNIIGNFEQRLITSYDGVCPVFCQLCATDTDNNINVSLLSKETLYSAKKNQVQRHKCQYLTLKYINNSNWPPFWKTKPMFIQCQNYMEPENIDIDTNIKFLSPLFAEIWDIENSHRPF